MIRVESPKDQVNVAKVYEAHQEQIFEYWDELSAGERKRLLGQIDTIDFREFSRLLRTVFNGGEKKEVERLADLTPMEMIPLPRRPMESQERARAAAAGMELLRKGRVGVFLVAGGQGTRLRFDGPKGMFPIGPVTERSLFQIFAEKILALQRRVKRPIPWFIMTSDTNDETTREFFHENQHFGLNPGDVYFRRQGMLPVVDPRRGKILLRARGELVLSPNGHGGSVGVIRGLRDTLQKRGIRYLFYHQVDNPMVKMCDPAFIGYHILRDSEFSSKAIVKEHPDEKVGIFCRAGNEALVVEYTELGKRERHALDEDGGLAFRAGNLAQHVISVDFLCPEWGDPPFDMPYHVARKAVAHLRDGELQGGEEQNSVRFESFLFDILPRARNPMVLEADRTTEYAPVKSFQGENSPGASRQAMMDEWAAWLAGCGVQIPKDGHGRIQGSIEISPLFASSLEELRERLDGRSVFFKDPLLLE